MEWWRWRRRRWRRSSHPSFFRWVATGGGWRRLIVFKWRCLEEKIRFFQFAGSFEPRLPHEYDLSDRFVSSSGVGWLDCAALRRRRRWKKDRLWKIWELEKGWVLLFILLYSHIWSLVLSTCWSRMDGKLVIWSKNLVFWSDLPGLFQGEEAKRLGLVVRWNKPIRPEKAGGRSVELFWIACWSSAGPWG